MFENIINKLGKNNVNRWVLECCVMFCCVGIFEFFYIWLNRFNLEGFSKFCFTYFFSDYVVMFIQVYSILFVPLIVFFGFKYRDSLKFNSKKVKTIIIILLILGFSSLSYLYKFTVLAEWAILFMIIFVIISLRFNIIFAFSFSYLSFVCANMFFEMQGLNFLLSFGTLLSYILIYGIFVFILIKMKIKIDLSIFLSFGIIVFYWVSFYSIWQLSSNEISLVLKPIQWYIRLFTFPFFIIVALKIYFTDKKHKKT